MVSQNSMNLLRKIGQLMICKKKKNIGEIFNRAYTITTNENDKVLVADINKFKSDKQERHRRNISKRFNEIITSLGAEQIRTRDASGKQVRSLEICQRKLMIYNYII